MFKQIIFCSLFVMAVSSSPSAFADSASPYVGVTIGTPLTSINKLSDSSGSLDTESNLGYMAGLTAGAVFEMSGGWNVERIRAEAEIGYRSSELVRLKNKQGQTSGVNGTVEVTNIMVNGYLENTSMLSSDLPVTIFLTAGAGAATASISSISYQGATLIKSARNTQLAYQGGLGFGYGLTNSITLDAAYKYMGTTRFNFAGIMAEYGSHNILLGARYTFK